MTTIPDHCTAAAAAFDDTESLTVLLATGATRESVAAALEVDLTEVVESGWEDENKTAWAILEIPGGVLAVEETGYGDPSVASLLALSKSGQTSAVVRTNIQAHLRFGCARDGEILFDDDEYMYIEDPDQVPEELQPLFRLAWSDLTDDADNDEDLDGFVVGLAMACLVTGLNVTAEQVATAQQTDYFPAPNLVYIE